MIRTDSTSIGSTQVDYTIQILEDSVWEEFYTFDTLEKAKTYFQMLKESDSTNNYRLLSISTLLVDTF